MKDDDKLSDAFRHLIADDASDVPSFETIMARPPTVVSQRIPLVALLLVVASVCLGLFALRDPVDVVREIPAVKTPAAGERVVVDFEYYRSVVDDHFVSSTSDFNLRTDSDSLLAVDWSSRMSVEFYDD